MMRHAPIVSLVLLCWASVRASAPAAWRLSEREGAHGSAAMDPAQPAPGPGSPSCRIVKRDGLGAIDLAWPSPFPARAGKNYILRLPYRTEDGSIANLLLFRAIPAPDAAPPAGGRPAAPGPRTEHGSRPTSAGRRSS